MLKSASAAFLLFLFAHSVAFSQSSNAVCVQNLGRAQKLYDQGELQQVISLIEECTTGAYLNKVQLVDAHRLIVLSYLFLDRMKEAQAQYKKLLKADPNYVPNAITEPIELSQLHNSFQTHPVSALGFSVGGNFNRPIIVENNKQVYRADGLRLSNRVSSLRFGSQFGLAGEFQPFNNIAVNTKLLLVNTKHQFEETLFGGDQLNFEETQSWFELPVSLRYYFGKRNKIRFFLETGVAGRLLNKSEASIERLVTDGKDVTGPSIDVSSVRRETNYAYLFGAGLRRSLGHVLLYAELNLRYDVNQQVEEAKRYSNQELLFLYGYVDEDFRAFTPSVSVGLRYAIYQHRIKKKKRE